MEAAGWIVTFLLTTLVGVAIWLADHRVLPEWLIGEGLLDSFLFEFFGLPLFMIATAVAGFVSPRAFWLWGLAIALPVPVVDAILTRQLIVQGLMEPAELEGVTVIAVIIAVEIAVVCTLTSALGAGSRRAARRSLVGRSSIT